MSRNTTLNAAMTPRSADQRQREKILKRRVVVETEIGVSGEREDRVSEVGKVAMLDDFMVEDPLIPDVHTGVAAWLPGEVRTQVERQAAMRR